MSLRLGSFLCLITFFKAPTVSFASIETGKRCWKDPRRRQCRIDWEVWEGVGKPLVRACTATQDISQISGVSVNIEVHKEVEFSACSAWKAERVSAHHFQIMISNVWESWILGWRSAYWSASDTQTVIWSGKLFYLHWPGTCFIDWTGHELKISKPTASNLATPKFVADIGIWCSWDQFAAEWKISSKQSLQQLQYIHPAFIPYSLLFQIYNMYV